MARLGVIHYNFPGFSFEEFLRYCADTGFEYVELNIADVWLEDVAHPLSAADTARQSAHTEKIRKQLESYGITASALAARNDFVQLDPEAIEYEVARMRGIAGQVALLCPDKIIRSEGGYPKETVPEERWAEAMKLCFERCPEFLEELGVTLAIDNHGYVTNKGDVLLDVLRTVNHPLVGSNLDTMNLRWAGNSLETCDQLYKELAPFVKHTHLKDGFNSLQEYKGAALGEGEIHLQVALNALKAVGYQGVYAAEYEGPELEGGVGYAKCLQWMKKNVA